MATTRQVAIETRSGPNHHPAASLYLDLLKQCLTRSIFPETYEPLRRPASLRFVRRKLSWGVYPLLKRLLAFQGLELVRRRSHDAARRRQGRDWPAEAETMIGNDRLDHLQTCVTDVIQKRVPGDLIETGVWRGGAGILMRAVLQAYGERDRNVWVADSFQGLPQPDPERYPEDAADTHWQQAHRLAVPLEEVQSNFRRYGLLDGQVRFLVGWFRDTLPSAPIGPLAILRLDGDMYESTIEALAHLYPKLSVGGYVIIDDYGSVLGCRRAVEDFRTKHQIKEELQHADHTAVYWQRVH